MAAGAYDLEVTRHYNSFLNEDMGFGVGWSAAFLRRLEPYPGDSSGYILIARQGSGRGEIFHCNTSPCGAYRNGTMALSRDTSGYTLTHLDNSTERYDLNRRLVSATDAAGRITTYGYDANSRVTIITGPFGRTLTIGYDAQNHIANITDSAGGTTTYSYHAYTYNDGTVSSVILSGVSYPDTTGKIYHYEDPRYPNLMTGISYVDASGSTVRYSTYGYYRNIANQQDPNNGNAIVTQHAQTGNASPQERFEISYDSTTQSTVTDPADTKEVLTYTTNYGLSTKLLTSKVNQSDGKSLHQTFDYNNNLTCKKDPDGRVTRYGYNSTNQRTFMTEGLSRDCANSQTTSATRTTTYQYLSANLNLPTLIESPSVSAGASKRTTITYTGNLPSTITQTGFTPAGAAVSRSVTLGYNSYGQVTAINGPRTDVNDVTALAYNECTTGGGCGRLRSLTNAAGHTMSFDSYDAAGRLLQMTDPNGLVTTYQYDPRGRVRFVNQGGRVTEYRYNAAGNVTFVGFPDGRMLSYTYDAAQQLTRVTDNAGNRVDYAYDTRGNRTGESTYDATGTLVREVAMAFDARNHVSAINAAGSLTQRINDALGNVLSTTDPKNNPPTQNQYDALSRLVQTVNALGGTTGYGYDAADRATQVAAPNGAVTQYVYDDLGNLLEERSPDRGTTRYTHDAAGNILTQTDARGVTATYTYDALNRVTTIRYSSTTTGGTSTEDVTYTYDTGTDCTAGIGRLCTVVDASGETRYGYDAFGNVLAQTHAELSRTYVTRYTYDAADRVTSLTYPDNRVVTYLRDALGRIEHVSATVGGTTQSIASNRRYRPDGLLTDQTFGNGLSESRQYDLQGRLTYLYAGSADTRVYAYDANGNLTSLQSLPQVGAYTYDAIDRLTQDVTTTSTTNTLKLTYDANGNRTKKASTVYSYDPTTNRLVRIGSTVRTLDAAGNTTADGAKTYSYNMAGQLYQTFASGTHKGTYVYNHLKQRTRKITGSAAGTYTLYHYDLAGNLILETNQNAVTKVAYVWAQGEALAHIKRASNVDTLSYLHVDHLGTPRAATNATQTVVWRWEGKAFGDTGAQQNPDADGTTTTINLRFPGQYYDSETALHYNWHRYYDPKLGRYITSDPIGLTGGINTYVYTNRPLNEIDPIGLMGRAPGSSGFKPPYPNGNYRPGHDRQDNVCSFPANTLDRNPCTQQCCIAHDACYTRNRCNVSSWWGNWYGHNSPCQQCNAEAARCVQENFGRRNCGAGCARE